MAGLGRSGEYVDVVWDSSNLRKRFDALDKKVAAAAKAAVTRTTKDAERALEEATRGAVAGKLWRAWTSAVYPERGLARDPSGNVFPKGRDRTRGALRAYAYGAKIRARDGQFLAIPLPAAGMRSTGRGRLPLTPGEWERRTGRILRLVYRRNKPSLLVADNAVIGKSGFARAATPRRVAQGRNVSTIPIFLLLPQVNIGRRFSIESTLAPYGERMRQTFVELLRRIDEVTGA